VTSPSPGTYYSLFAAALSTDGAPAATRQKNRMGNEALFSFDWLDSEGGNLSFSECRNRTAKVSNMARKNAIENMREVLIMRRDALRKALAGDLSMLKELREKTGGDEVDAALDAAQNEISSQLAEVESRELAHIENALQRIRNGHYSICEGCNNNIPLARLQALPYATFCIDCQRELEKSGELPDSAADWSRIVDIGSGDGDVILGDIELDVP